MKYVVVGAGGTGGCLGGFLAEQGHDVTLIARNRHLDEIRRNGLILKSCSLGERQIRSVKACTMEEYSDSPDVIFVCVKFYSLEEVIPFIRRTASENTLVIPILNVFGVLAPVVEFLAVGSLVAFVASPIVNMLEHHGVPRGVGALVGLVVVVAAILCLLLVIAPVFVEQVVDVASEINGNLRK